MPKKIEITFEQAEGFREILHKRFQALIDEPRINQNPDYKELLDDLQLTMYLNDFYRKRALAAAKQVP